MAKTSDFTEEYVKLNGITHYLLHYKSRPEDPVLIFIHGGPGAATSPFAYLTEGYSGRPYNIVYYDQRGAGMTYLKNPKASATVDLLISDLLAIVSYLKESYHKEQIGLLGHSWGSILGSLFALKYPEDVLCYIGCGQVVNVMEEYRWQYAKVKEAIERSGNTKDRTKLGMIYPAKPFDLKKILKLNNLVTKYQEDKLDPGMGESLRGWFNSPVVKGISLRRLLATVRREFRNKQLVQWTEDFDLESQGTVYHVPVYYILGDSDWTTPFELAAAYFDKIKAPAKKSYLLKDAGHLMMFNNEEYRQALTEIIEEVAS